MSVDLYREQVALLLRLLPIVGREEMFALKGGTAINLFVRDLPRLSVDIDLTFLPLTERDAALTAIGQGLQRIGALAVRQIGGATAVVSARRDAPKVVVSQQGAHVTIEPNTTLRGSVFPPALRRTTPAVEAEFGQSVSVPVLSEPDLYGGKIVAALDRQHPRDLFDIKLLFDAGGLTDDIRRAFVVVTRYHAMSRLKCPRIVPTIQRSNQYRPEVRRITSRFWNMVAARFDSRGNTAQGEPGGTQPKINDLDSVATALQGPEPGATDRPFSASTATLAHST
jgi:predicted nucleotidyltransferase component of viral defense system